MLDELSSHDEGGGPGSTAPLGMLQAPSGDRAGAAELHLSLNHLKMSWSCANRVPVNNNVLCREGEVLISPKNKRLHQEMTNSDRC